MRARLREADIKFVLLLLRREKREYDRKLKDREGDIAALELMIRRWRWKLINQSYYGFKDGFAYLKERLAHLKPRYGLTSDAWHYSQALKYLIFRYESMLRGKSGRPPNITGWNRGFLEALVKEKCAQKC